ncbi:MAG: hypothetical protein AB7F43_09660 [Bacteriovoracia bacterium]
MTLTKRLIISTLFFLPLTTFAGRGDCVAGKQLRIKTSNKVEFNIVRINPQGREVVYELEETAEDHAFKPRLEADYFDSGTESSVLIRNVRNGQAWVWVYGELYRISCSSLENPDLFEELSQVTAEEVATEETRHPPSQPDSAAQEKVQIPDTSLNRPSNATGTTRRVERHDLAEQGAIASTEQINSQLSTEM